MRDAFPRAIALALAWLSALACGGTPPARHAPSGPAPDSFQVVFTTSRGTFVVQANRAWAPAGVDRFHQLVEEGFFDENRFYRVLPGFIAQFGANDDPKRNEEWEGKPLAADPRREKNRRGTVSFAMLDPASRTHQLFINLKDNPNLDAQGFAPVGRVVEGMGVVDSLYAGYGEKPQYQLVGTLGNRYLARMFPRLDYIRTARQAPSTGSGVPR
jgi:peptidyl-prolyl cis-trans isomerase A (cyclophilin A)